MLSRITSPSAFLGFSAFLLLTWTGPLRGQEAAKVRPEVAYDLRRPQAMPKKLRPVAGLPPQIQTAVVTFKNSNPEDLTVCIGYYDQVGKTWVSKGFWNVPSRGQVQIPVPSTYKEIRFRAWSERGVVWGGGEKLWFGTGGAFEVRNAESPVPVSPQASGAKLIRASFDSLQLRPGQRNAVVELGLALKGH